MVIQPFERGLSFSSRLCHHHQDGCCLNIRSAGVPRRSRGPSTSAGQAACLRAEAQGLGNTYRVPLKVVLILTAHIAMRLNPLLHDAVVLSSLRKAPGCVVGSDGYSECTWERDVGFSHSFTHTCPEASGKVDCDST